MDLKNNLFVCSLAQMPYFVKTKGITHMITLMTSAELVDDGFHRPKALPVENWLHVDIRDTSERTYRKCPTMDDMQKVLDWAVMLPEDAKLLVHCYAGISRSTSTALAIAVQANGIDKIDECYDWLMEHRPIAVPNLLMTEYYDLILGADLQLVEKVLKAREDAAGKLILI